MKKFGLLMIALTAVMIASCEKSEDALSKPSGLSEQVNQGTATLSWSAVADAEKYEVSFEEQIVSVAATSYNITLTEPGDYSWKVRSVAGGRKSGWSEKVFTVSPASVANGTYSYIGTLVVDQNNGTFYTQENVRVEVAQVDETTVEIKMFQAKFAERMPLNLDMTIAGVTFRARISKIEISGDNIIPTAMGGPFPAYTITNMTGTVSASSIDFSMICGNFPLTFQGNAQ